jgi:hypothetical protein
MVPSMVRVVIVVAAALGAAVGGFLIGANSYDVDRAVEHHGIGRYLPALLRPISTVAAGCHEDLRQEGSLTRLDV